MLFMSKFQVMRTLPVLHTSQPNFVDWWVASVRTSLRLSGEGTFHHYFTQLASGALRRAGKWGAPFQARALHHSHLYILHHPTGPISGSAPYSPLFLSKLTAHIQQYQVAWPHSVWRRDVCFTQRAISFILLIKVKRAHISTLISIYLRLKRDLWV